MASKSTKNKYKRKKNKKKKYNGLVNKLKKNGLLDNKKLVFEPYGEVKMSDILLEYVEPYMDSVKTDEEYKKLFTVAMIAWNVSFLPEDEQKKTISNFKTCFPPPLQNDFIKIVNMMIERKNTYFSEYKRKIIDYTLKDLGDEINISVASTL